VSRLVRCIGAVALTVLVAAGCGGAAGDEDGANGPGAAEAAWLADVFEVAQAELGDSITLMRLVATPTQLTLVEVQADSVTAHTFDEDGTLTASKPLKETVFPALLFLIYEVEPEAASRILATITAREGRLTDWTAIAERDKFSTLRWRVTVTVDGQKKKVYVAGVDGSAVKPLDGV
jgi:hypothetical protein